MALPSYTKTWHNDTYDAIDPLNPALSATGKTVFITGGGSGVGAGIVDAFAATGAARIAISGRTEKTLLDKKREVEAAHPNSQVSVFVADVVDEKAVPAAFESLGKVDILVHNAGAMSKLEPLSTASISEWWKGVEVNIKGSLIVTQAFLKVAPQDAVLVNVTTGAAHLPPFPDHSSYVAGKIGSNKFFDAVQVENPNLRVVNIHPGVIKSAMSDRSVEHGIRLPFDDGVFWPTLSSTAYSC